MVCGKCGQKSPVSPSAAVTAGSQVLFKVTRNGKPTGRQFTSLVAATRYANALPGDAKVEPV